MLFVDVLFVVFFLVDSCLLLLCLFLNLFSHVCSLVIVVVCGCIVCCLSFVSVCDFSHCLLFVGCLLFGVICCLLYGACL